MSRNIFQIEQGLLGFSLTDPGNDILTLTIGDFDAYSCQVTSGALNATPNTTDVVTPATWCEAEETETVPGITSYELACTFLQDPHVAAGINRFLFEHDTETVWFFMGFNGVDPPKATGRVNLVAGTVGGAARETLTFDVTLPCKGKPVIAFGDEVSHAVVGGPATGATAGTPGTWTPSGSEAPASFTALSTASPAITATPGTAWTSGQHVVLGDNTHAYWNGTAWTSGTVALMAMAGAESGEE